MWEYAELAKAVADSAFEQTSSGALVSSVGSLLSLLLSLPPGSSTLYVRPCVQRLYDYIDWENNGHQVLTGTPGIGKSVALLYFLIRRVREHDQTVCYYDQTHSEGWIFSHGKCWRGSREFLDMMLENHQTTPNVLILLDRVHGNPTSYPWANGRYILSSTPRAENYEFWEKRNPLSRIHLPTWTLEELLDFRITIHPNVSEDLVTERFKLYDRVAVS